MLKSSFVFLHLAVVGINVLGAFCFTTEEEIAMGEALKPLIMDCIEECGITDDDLKKGKQGDIDPCLKKCVLKKLGLLNDDGKYDRDAVRERMLMFTDNEDEIEKVQGTLDECFKDKEEQLKTDKDAEMKRVDIVFECLKNFKQ